MTQPKCELCGEPMPRGEEMFKFHGYSGPCPKPPLPRTRPPRPRAFKVTLRSGEVLTLTEGVTDIPSVLDACWQMAHDLKLTIEVVDGAL